MIPQLNEITGTPSIVGLISGWSDDAVVDVQPVEIHVRLYDTKGQVYSILHGFLILSCPAIFAGIVVC